MKKSLLFLLPAAALMLAGCNNGGGGSTAESTSRATGLSTSTPAPTSAPTTAPDPTNYGSLENPLTVTEALAIAQAQCANDGDITKQRVYTTGIVVGGNESQYGWNNFYLAESKAEGAAKVLAYSVNKDDSGKMGYPNDTVIVEGFIKNYQGTIEYANSAKGVQDYPTFAKITRGTSAISITADHATVNGLTATAENGSELEFTVTPDANYVVDKVKINNVEATAEEGKYKLAVKGDMAVTVETHEEGQPTETLVYKLDGTKTDQGTNAYAEASEIKQGDVDWSVVANTTINPWRFGGKNLDHVERAATAKGAVSSDDVCKVVATVPGFTATFHSATLKVGSTEGADDLASLKIERSFVEPEELSFEKTDSTSWASAYFTLVFEVSCGGSNQFVKLSALEFYAMK